MAKPTVNSRCSAFIELHNPRCKQCSDLNGVYKCRGCFEAFCEQHVIPHREPMKKQLRDLRYEADRIRTEVDQLDFDSKGQQLLEEINQWQQKSIMEINRIADEAREIVSRTTHDGGHARRTQLLACRDVFRTRLEEAERKNDYHERHLEYWTQFLADLQSNFQRLRAGYAEIEYGEMFIRKLRARSVQVETPFEFAKWCYFERNCGPCYDIRRSGSIQSESCCQSIEVPPCIVRHPDTINGAADVRYSSGVQLGNYYANSNSVESNREYYVVDDDDRASHSSQHTRRSLLFVDHAQE